MDPALPFVRTVRMRYDEAGADGEVRASSLVRHIQDVAWQHSEAAGFDRGWYASRGLGWLVRGIDLELLGAAAYGDTLEVTTQVVGWRHMWARRRSHVRRQDGSPVARAVTDWVLLNAAGRPTRVPAEIEAFAPAAATFTPISVALPATPQDASQMEDRVRQRDVDPMGHLNNAAYLDLLTEALESAPAGRGLAPGRRVRLEYLHPALPGMAVLGATWELPDGVAYRLCAVDGATELLRALVSPAAGSAR